MNFGVMKDYKLKLRNLHASHFFVCLFATGLKFVVYYESIKRELKIRGIYECRCDERLLTKTKRFRRLPYTLFLCVWSFQKRITFVWWTGVFKENTVCNCDAAETCWLERTWKGWKISSNISCRHDIDFVWLKLCISKEKARSSPYFVY